MAFISAFSMPLGQILAISLVAFVVCVGFFHFVRFKFTFWHWTNVDGYTHISTEGLLTKTYVFSKRGRPIRTLRF